MKSKWIITASVLTLASLVLVWWQFSKTAPEVVMSIGDSYEKIERASSYKMDRDLSSLTGSWFTDVREPASLHFNDPEYAFITPPAKFLSISAGGGHSD